MRITQLFFFSLILTSLQAQSDISKNIDTSKFLWDIHTGLSIFKQHDPQIGGFIHVNLRFKGKFFAGVSYNTTFEPALGINIAIPFGSSIEIAESPSIYTVKTALVGGYHFKNDKLYGAVSIGPNYMKGTFFNENNKKYQNFSNLGVDTRVQITLPLSRRVGLGFAYNYNINALKNSQNFMVGWHFGLLR